MSSIVGLVYFIPHRIRHFFGLATMNERIVRPVKHYVRITFTKDLRVSDVQTLQGDKVSAALVDNKRTSNCEMTYDPTIAQAR